MEQQRKGIVVARECEISKCSGKLTRTGGKQDMTADWRATEKADVIRDWLPTSALAVATTNIGQKRGCGMAAK